MSYTISQRFAKCIEHLNDNGVIKSIAAFAEDIGTHRQTVNAIMKGRREVRMELVQQAVEKYYFNPYYLLSGQGDMFDKPEEGHLQKSENIKLVPIKAQAGYSDHILDPLFQGDLPRFNLPFSHFENGDFVAFEVEGQSMYPTLDEGDVVICSKLAPQYYAHTIKDDKVYVVVTKEEVLVKRIENRIHQAEFLCCKSDNLAYKEINIKMKSIKEVWKIEGALKKSLPYLGVDKETMETALSTMLTKLTTKT